MEQQPTQRELSERALTMKKAVQAAKEEAKTADIVEAEAAKKLAQASDTSEAFFPARIVWERYGITDMTLWRWVRNERMHFPQPIYFGRFRYWRQSELVRWEQDRTAARDKAQASAA